MTVQSVSSVSFKGNQQQVERQKGGAGKAVITWFIPGLGEFLDGRNKQGVAYLGSRIGVGALAGLLYSKQMQNILQAMDEGVEVAKSNKLLAPIVGILGLVSFGLAIANVVDAYKGGSDKKIDKQA